MGRKRGQHIELRYGNRPVYTTRIRHVPIALGNLWCPTPDGAQLRTVQHLRYEYEL